MIMKKITVCAKKERNISFEHFFFAQTTLRKSLPVASSLLMTIVVDEKDRLVLPKYKTEASIQCIFLYTLLNLAEQLLGSDNILLDILFFLTNM